jgi:pimeloyl-ACP methyl ester carboxylesterase
LYPHWTENTISVNGIALHYTRTGDGSKPPLVLAHGFSDHGLCWLPVARDLEASYDVILPDARGHGKSARVQPGEAVDLPGDLAGLIGALGLRNPIVGGHSMGAATAAQMEAHFPGVARALLLEDPPWREPEPPKDPPPTPAPPASMSQWIIDLKELSEAKMIAKCRADNPIWPDVELQPWAESKIQFDLGFLQAARFRDPDWSNVVKALSVPTLLLTADPAKGAIVTPASAQKAAALNAHVKVAKIEGAGHCIRRENYTDYMAALTTYLKELAA